MREDLITELQSYETNDSEEKGYIAQFFHLLENPRCFYRDCFPGHITGSSVLINPAGDQILMNHHKTLNKWMNFGGHADGEEDILAVAIRETMEESGITAFKPVLADFIDIDIHEIPANPKKNEPAHFHYDVRYVMQMTGDQKPVISDESTDLQWMTFEEALEAGDSSTKRFIKKTQDLMT